MHVQLFRYDLPLRRPLVLAGLTHHRRTALLIKCHVGESILWGETAPLPGFSRESFDQARLQLKEVLSEGIVSPADMPGDRPAKGLALSLQLSDFLQRQRSELYPSVEWGLWNVFAGGAETVKAIRTAGNPRSVPPRETSGARIPVNGLLVGDGTELTNRAIELARNGFLAVKLKVGGREITKDIERVWMVREICGADMAIRLDANRAWELSDAIEFCHGIAGARIEYLEEPLRQPNNTLILAQTGVPLAWDETTREIAVNDAVAVNGLAAVILKPMLLGKETTCQWIDWAHRNRIRPVISSSFESGCGIAALARFAAWAGLHNTPCGFDTLSWFAADVLRLPLPIRNGAMELDTVLEHSEQVDESRLIEEPL